jgi:hypothetical protein
MEGGEPVEIELTPTEPRPPKTHRVERTTLDDTSSDTSSDPPVEARAERWTDGYSRRAVITIACVGIGALGLGWVLGSSRSSDPGGDAATIESTRPSPDRSPAISGETLAPVEPIVTTTDAAPRTTTTVAPIESETIQVDAILADAAYELVGLDWWGNLIRLDLASGDLETRHDLGTEGAGGPSVLWAGDGWAIVPDWNTGSATLVEPGSGPARLDIGPPWQIFAAETPGEFWTLDQNLRVGAPGTAQRVDRHGDPIGDPVSLSEIPLYSDPAGGLVVQANGTAYRVDGDQISKIVDGMLLALDDRRAVARTCDDQLQCGFVVIDRDTGVSTPLPVDPNIRPSTGYRWSTDVWRIAPDGHTMALTWTDPAVGESLGLVDLDTGDLTTLSEYSDGVLQWTPDARFALFLEAGLPMAHEIATGESFVISDDLPRLNAVAVRPRTEG